MGPSALQPGSASPPLRASPWPLAANGRDGPTFHNTDAMVAAGASGDARRRLSVSLKSEPALEVGRVTLQGEKLVYVLCQDKKHQYARRAPASCISAQPRTGSTVTSASFTRSKASAS